MGRADLNRSQHPLSSQGDLPATAAHTDNSYLQRRVQPPFDPWSLYRRVSFLNSESFSRFRGSGTQTHPWSGGQPASGESERPFPPRVKVHESGAPTTCLKALEEAPTASPPPWRGCPHHLQEISPRSYSGVRISLSTPPVIMVYPHPFSQLHLFGSSFKGSLANCWQS